MSGGEAQLTLVALHGSRPAALERLLDDCVEDTLAIAGDRFRPYAAAQRHATVIGLETVVERNRRIHRNLLEHHGEHRAWDLAAFAELLGGDAATMTVRFGGFAPDERPFTSRGLPPWERSFSVQHAAGGDRAVVIGWPEEPGPPPRFPQALDDLRRAARRFGIAHAYHRTPTDRDNDLYMRLGLFRTPLPLDARERLEARVRQRLARHGPVRVPLGPDALKIAAYRSPELPPATTVARPLVGLDLSRSGIEELLRSVPESG